MSQLYQESTRYTGKWAPPVSPARRDARILLCESQAMFRQGLKKLLEGEPGFRIIGEVASGYDAIRYALATRPDLIITEAHLYDLDGLTVAQAILQENLTAKVIILSDFLEMRHLEEAAEVGVKACIPKAAGVAELIEAIKRVLTGESLLDISLWANVAKGVMEVKASNTQAALTNKEKGILEQVASGYSNQEIALTLGMSEKTVRNRLSAIYGKLHVHNRTQAAVYAVKEGIAAP
jgi:two-component system, NarL family, response regulator LiaR